MDSSIKLPVRVLKLRITKSPGSLACFIIGNMPIFEYRCQKCSEEFEKIIMGEEKNVECPQCGGTETKKLLSSFAVQSSTQVGFSESGPCPCGAAERGMCQGPQFGRK
jgi:putative FmdB family regulatory protein